MTIKFEALDEYASLELKSDDQYRLERECLVAMLAHDMDALRSAELKLIDFIIRTTILDVHRLLDKEELSTYFKTQKDLHNMSDLELWHYALEQEHELSLQLSEDEIFYL